MKWPVGLIYPLNWFVHSVCIEPYTRNSSQSDSNLSTFNYNGKDNVLIYLCQFNVCNITIVSGVNDFGINNLYATSTSFVWSPHIYKWVTHSLVIVLHTIMLHSHQQNMDWWPWASDMEQTLGEQKPFIQRNRSEYVTEQYDFIYGLISKFAYNFNSNGLLFWYTSQASDHVFLSMKRDQ